MAMRQLKITKSVTNRDSDSLESYLQEMSKQVMITPEEEVRLALRIKKGDEKALDKLVRANLRFVVSVAKQYQNQGLSLSDLINEGNLGLIKAAQRFDETRGFKFISYAVWWIRQSILQALAEQARIVRLPLNKIGLSNRIQKAYSHLEQEYEREPTPEEIAELLEIGIDEVESTLGINVRHCSLDNSLDAKHEETTLLDVLEDPNTEAPDQVVEYDESLKSEINRCLHLLTDRQREIILYFFGIGVDHPMSLEDIGKKFDLTRERVRQIKDKGLMKLRQEKLSKFLKPYI